MLYLSILTTLLLSTTTFGLPSPLLPNAEDSCTPTSYTLSAYTLSISPTSAQVSFTLRSNFTNTSAIVDSVINGAQCTAAGSVIPNNNECEVDNRKLLFDLRGPQEEAYYQISHTWACGGSTWMSGTPLKVGPLACVDEGTARTCSSDTQTFVPQNVRKICGAPQC
ncbi:hypothetical protein T440DRAFT_396639 [Plenodomus tracheiphilus IPT5]|uniref:Hypersensitive response inducing protein 1 n=1 Tax=Plenodomus tracheiphilus IPT5 TaxID=1408161 RepID=A0A6A7B5K8_9PLEO|nr:hypothetical protein T440DRAFT_396639 [Plenodomus tracheiphilus IPT5]